MTDVDWTGLNNSFTQLTKHELILTSFFASPQLPEKLFKKSNFAAEETA